MISWLISFVLSSSLGLFVERSAEFDKMIISGSCIALPALFIFFGITRSCLRTITICMCGALWGWLHSAPSAEVRQEYETLRLNLINNGWKVPQIALSSGKIVQVRAPAISRGIIRGRGSLGQDQLFQSPAFASVKRKPADWASQKILATDPAWPTAHLRRSALMFFGEGNLMPGDQLAWSLKATGTYHLLVVSGLHVSLIALISGIIIRVLPHLAFIFRWISSGAWVKWNVASSFLGGIVAATIIWKSGLEVPAQRSLIVYFGSQIQRFSRSPSKRSAALLASAVLQTLLFPIGFVAGSTLVSWGAYLLVLPVTRKKSQGPWKTLNLQLKLFCITTGAFGFFAPLAIVVNVWAIPMFTPVLITSPLPFVIPGKCPEWVVSGVLKLHEFYFGLLGRTSGLVVRWPWLCSSLNRGFCQHTLRIIFLGAGIAFVLTQLANLDVKNCGVNHKS